MRVNWRDHIVSTPDVLRGKPRIKGTRIPVSLILGYLAAGNSPKEIIKEFPDLTEEFLDAIRQGISEAHDGGVLMGYPVIDVRTALLDVHIKETSDVMAFKIAANMAFKKA